MGISNGSVHIGGKYVGRIAPERIAGRRLVDDTPVSLADLIHSYRRRASAARLATEEAQQAADALNEGLAMVGGRDASATLDGFTYQHSLGGLKVAPAFDPSTRLPG